MDDQIARIRAKLTALPAAEKATLGGPVSEKRITEFENGHGIRLPEQFRQFLTRIGNGGYGPTYGLLPMEEWHPAADREGEGHLSTPFPVVPDLGIPESLALDDGPVDSYPGTITVVYRGCSDLTLLVVTGPGRGRLVEVNTDGFFCPRFHADSDFLAWYERWLDFVLTGHRDLNWFADQMAGSEEDLVATLLGDTLPARRRAAAYTFITHPKPSPSLPEILLQAYETEPHSAVRETILRAMAAQGEPGRDLLSAALADQAANVRSLAAVLMTVPVTQGRQLSPTRRQALTDRMTIENDASVLETIQRMLDHPH
ncbi:SMI1/KNR4 family protein [Streptomyces sp. NPDC016459]|uniref:SMI1/KNR4 family protein n=1 Tax=Streptomyces sp. NPDC016459 TaxID=3157190 RepID=UPI0033C31EFC